jgi:hypothetical protein
MFNRDDSTFILFMCVYWYKKTSNTSGKQILLCERATSQSYRYDNAELLIKICFEWKDPRACSYAGRATLSQPKLDQKSGLKAFSFACDHSKSYECNQLLKKSIELKEGKYLQERCNSGVAAGCLLAGIYGRELNEDPRKRLSFYQKACNLGEKEGCEFERLIPKSIAMYDCELKKDTRNVLMLQNII